MASGRSRLVDDAGVGFRDALVQVVAAHRRDGVGVLGHRLHNGIGGLGLQAAASSGGRVSSSGITADPRDRIGSGPSGRRLTV